MDELIRLLSIHQNDQNEAIRGIEDFSKRDFTSFLKYLSEIIFNQQNSPVIRTAAGLQLKNQLTSRDDATRQRQQKVWLSLPLETRQYIKERVLGTLGTEIHRPSSAPQCAAYIALAELPENNLSTFIKVLTSNVGDPKSSPQLRLASLEAIGYICQDIDQSCLLQDDLDSILTAIVGVGMRDTETDEVKVAAVNALVNICSHKLIYISKTHQSLSFQELGHQLKLEPQHAEKVVAQMIRQERIRGHLDQIDNVVHFETKEVLDIFDESIQKLCSEVNDVIEMIRVAVPPSWWAINAIQS